MTPEEDKVLETRELTWDDLGYHVVAESHEYRLDVTVYPIFEMWDADHKPLRTPAGGPWLVEKEMGGSPVAEKDKAEVILTGVVKWDSCSDWWFDAENVHFCTKQEASEIGTLIARLYDLAAEMVPSWSN